MGSSIAAYCARAGIDAKIFVPQGLRGPKYKQMQAHGAEIVRVEGDYDLAAKQAWQEYEERGNYLLGDYPYRGEGEKTVGFEIAEQIEADKIVIPVGNGTLLHSIWKSYKELEMVGLIEDIPQMVGVQAEGCNTVVGALTKGKSEPIPLEKVDTVAGAIACGDPLDGEQAIQSIEESEGFGLTVSDEEIMEAKKLLATKEGIYAEEAGAAALAALIYNKDKFREKENVVCLVTGHGLKT